MDDQRRRVLIRLIGAPLLVATLLGVLYWDHCRADQTGLLILVIVMSCAAILELDRMMRLKGLKPASLAAMVLLVLMYIALNGVPQALKQPGIDDDGVLARFPTTFLTFAMGMILTMYVLVCLVTSHGRFAPPDAGATLLIFFYISLGAYLTIWTPGTTAGGMAHASLYLAFLFATNKGSDMAAYGVGKLIGRHKMAPVLSPNKTWEGAIAGLIAGGGLGAWILLGPLREAFHASAGALVVMAVVVTVAAQTGDLVKSAIKRWAGVKDSGRLLPEFGGALDMIDTFLLSGPVAWVFGQALK